MAKKLSGYDPSHRILVAARDAGVKRFVYAASSPACGDRPVLRKTNELISALPV